MSNAPAPQVATVDVGQGPLHVALPAGATVSMTKADWRWQVPGQKPVSIAQIAFDGHTVELFAAPPSTDLVGQGKFEDQVLSMGESKDIVRSEVTPTGAIHAATHSDIRMRPELREAMMTVYRKDLGVICFGRWPIADFKHPFDTETHVERLCANLRR